MKETKAEAKTTAAEEAAEQEFLSKQVGEEAAPEQKNVYTYQTSSTTEATMDSEEFRKLKLTT